WNYSVLRNARRDHLWTSIYASLLCSRAQKQGEDRPQDPRIRSNHHGGSHIVAEYVSPGLLSWSEVQGCSSAWSAACSVSQPPGSAELPRHARSIARRVVEWVQGPD